MIAFRAALALGTLALIVGSFGGCDRLPGKPRPADRELIPSQVMAFDVLYARNCAGCHGADGRLGAARPLNDAVYLALVPRERLRAVIAEGVAGTAQPGFAVSAGGTLTDAQIDALVSGLLAAWGRPGAARSLELPPYSAGPPAAAAGGADAERGRAVYATACASCHGADGRGSARAGSIVDASYLALVSDQSLRTTVIAGRTDLGMPDWRGYTPARALTTGEISDIVAWLSAQRRPVSGRPASPRLP